MNRIIARLMTVLLAFAPVAIAPTVIQAGLIVYEYSGSTQTFVVPIGVTSVNVLAIGGGGGGANGHQGGGGAGYLATGTFAVSAGQSYNIIVGQGGTGAMAQFGNNTIIGLTSGTGSSFGSLLTAGGGQVVVGINSPGNDGSSGGGGSGNGGIGGAGGSGGSDGSASTYFGGMGQGNYLASLSLFTEAAITAGAGGAGGIATHGGGGGAGGIQIDGLGPNGQDGENAVVSAKGGVGYGAGGGGGSFDAVTSLTRFAGGDGANGAVYVEWQTSAVPEPTSLVLFCSGLALVVRRRRA